ncbi:uncharacterized protein [Dermacentor albipictus]|uniref:uncharacterized protein isoform X2 n=1 Tax=Dermacentor albipictus TaxID=60249 RepID=UPI0038FD35D8
MAHESSYEYTPPMFSMTDEATYVQAVTVPKTLHLLWVPTQRFLRTPGVTRGTRKPRRLPTIPATSTVSLTMAALVNCTWGPSAASITQGPAQAMLAWRMHQPALKTAPRMLLDPEKGKSKRPAVPVERFPADGTPYTGNPTNTRVIRPPLSEHVINHLSRSRATNAKHVSLQRDIWYRCFVETE